MDCFSRPLRVAAYVRVSSDKDNQEDSYELQNKYFANLLSSNPNWISAGVYSDYAATGTEHVHRRGFNLLLRHCEEGKIDRIVCKSVSRFARNTADFLTAINFLQNKNVSVFFEKENLDTADPANEFVLTMLGAIAQEESRSTSENIRQGNKMRFPKGEVPNIEIYGYRFKKGEDEYKTTSGGYRMKQLEKNTEEADIVARIFEEYVQGSGMSAIANRLNREGIPAPKLSVQGVHVLEREAKLSGVLRKTRGWTGAKIGEIIEQQRYTGDVLVQKTFVESYLTHRSVKNSGQLPKYLVKNHHPAIIEREVFEAAQARRNSNLSRGVSRPHVTRPFTKLLMCGNCGRVLNVRNPKRPIWFCPSSTGYHGIKSCCAERVYEEQIIRMLQAAAVKRFSLYEGNFRDEAVTADILKGKIKWQNGGCGFHEEKERISEFLRCFRSEEVKKFVYGITVYSPLKFKVRWYDNSETDGELLSNVDEGIGLKKQYVQ